MYECVSLKVKNERKKQKGDKKKNLPSSLSIRRYEFCPVVEILFIILITWAKS